MINENLKKLLVSFLQKFGLWPWIIFISLMIMLGWNLPPPNLDNISTCPLKEKRKDAPADNVVFFGSSSLGVAIDPFYIAKKLNDGTTIDYVIDVGSYSTKVLNNIYEYIENRGAPDVLVINIPTSFDLDVHNYLFEEKTLKSSYLGILLKVQSYFPDAYGRSKIINPMLFGWKSNVELVNYKISEAILSNFEIHVARYFKTKGEGNCKNNSLKPKFFPRNKINDDIDFKKEGLLIWMGMKKKMRMKKNKDEIKYLKEVKKHFPVNLTHQNDVQTLKVMQEIVRLYHDKVNMIYFTFGPQFAITEPISKKYANQLTKKYNNIKYINSVNAFKNPKTDLFNKKYFFNLKHLNYEGARIVSRFWVEILNMDKSWRH
jgi:hypothetical protein